MKIEILKFLSHKAQKAEVAAPEDWCLVQQQSYETQDQRLSTPSRSPTDYATMQSVSNASSYGRSSVSR
jgi:hypothetical protein